MPQYNFDPQLQAQRHRVRGIVWAGLGIGSVLTTTLLQAKAAQGHPPCVKLDSTHNSCLDPDGPGAAVLHTAGLTAFGIAAFGSMVAFGRARAYDDFRSRRKPARPIVSYVAAGALIGASSTLVFAGLHQKSASHACGGDQACVLGHRARQYSMIDIGALGTAAGAAIIGYALGRELQGRRLSQVHVRPTLSRSLAGLSISGRF